MQILTHLDRLRKEPITNIGQINTLIELHRMQTGEGMYAISNKLFGSNTYVSRMLTGNAKHFDLKAITLANYLRIQDTDGFLLLMLYVNEQYHSKKKNLTASK